MAHKRVEESDYVSGGEFGTEPTFPPQIQARIEKGYRCGSGIGKGWLPIVVALDELIAEIDPDYVIHQIKEKFAGLRYYIETKFKYDTPEGKQIYDYINSAEDKSLTVCDICGEPGTRCTPRRYWIVTRCEEHGKKEDE